MYSGYFNYRSQIAESWLDRSSFAWNWWRINARDPHWVPPYYPHFRRELEARHNRPYLPELARPLSEPLLGRRLYELAVSFERTAAVQSRAQIDPLIPRRLGEDLLPLFAGSLSDGEADPPPDADETSFLLRWVSYWPNQAWLASIGSQPVGFVMLGPDLAPRFKRARGGRNFFWRAWLRRAVHRPVRQGRIFFGGVLPGWRRQGIGLHLLQHASNFARDQGWEKLTAGPVPQDSAAAGLLERVGARPCQNYQMVRWDL